METLGALLFEVHMSIFSKQRVHCVACGRWHMTAFLEYDGLVCSAACHEEYMWRRTLSAMGAQYYPKPPAQKNTEPFVPER